MKDRVVFDSLSSWLISRHFSLKVIFWITGVISFCLSPLADNLTTALLMSTVIMSAGKSNTKFVVIACVNVVVAANAGGAFSPFGDITTLMVRQKGELVEFQQFFLLLVPSLVNWLVPASILFLFLSKGIPEVSKSSAQMKRVERW